MDGKKSAWDITRAELRQRYGGPVEFVNMYTGWMLAIMEVVRANAAAKELVITLPDRVLGDWLLCENPRTLSDQRANLVTDVFGVISAAKRGGTQIVFTNEA